MIVSSIHDINISNALFPDVLGFPYDAKKRNRDTYVARIPPEYKLTSAQIVVLSKISYMNFIEDKGATEKELATNGKAYGPLMINHMIELRQRRFWITEKGINALKVQMDYDYYKMLRTQAQYQKVQVEEGNLEKSKATALKTMRKLKNHAAGTERTSSETLLKNITKLLLFTFKAMIGKRSAQGKTAELQLIFNSDYRVRIAHAAQVAEIISYDFAIDEEGVCQVVVRWRHRVGEEIDTLEFTFNVEHV